MRWSGADQPLRLLRDSSAALDALRAPAETAFLKLGEGLTQALAVLNRLESDFTELTGRLEAEAGATTADGLDRAIAHCAGMAGEAARALDTLTRLEGTARTADRPLAALSKIVEEIGALAINAKIEAAQVAALDTDFSVFTTEIARLGALAGEAVDTAADRLGGLRDTIAKARTAEQSFTRSESAELDAVRGRLESSRRALAERKARAQTAAQTVGAKARQIAGRVSACIGDLQINDMTSQRLEHVRHALELLCGVIDPASARLEGCEWAGDLDESHRAALVAAVCRLQAQQLGRAAEDFVTAVAGLKSNLHGLAANAGEVLAQAVAVLGSGDADTTFVRELEDNVHRAATLLSAYAESESRVQEQIATVSQGFAAMTDDLEAIHSIDADLRIMGLNASFKCGRLGRTGQALGVVAQELRACSRRTEENTHAVSATIAAAVQVSQELAERTRAERDGAEALSGIMDAAIGALRRLEGDLAAALTRLGEECRRTAALLSAGADRVDVDQRLKTVADTVAARLQSLAGPETASPAAAEAIRDDVRRLLAKHYTMASERIVHELFAEGAPAETPAAKPAAKPAAGAPAPAEDIDDLLF